MAGPAQMAQKLGMLVAGNNLFIRGQPSQFTPELAKHFLLVESTLNVASFALGVVHYVSTFWRHPERHFNAVQCFNECATRSEAQIFWTGYVSKVRQEPINGFARASMLTWQVISLSFWLPLSAIAPGGVHTVLHTANDVLYKKYETTSFNAPSQFYDRHLSELAKHRAHHANCMNFSLCPFTLVIIIILTFFR